MEKKHIAAFPYALHTITLLNNVKCDATGDVTTAYALTDDDRAALIGATQNINGYCIMQVQGTGVSGSGTPVPSITLTGVLYSVDGTNYATWQTISGTPVISGTGITGQAWISSPVNPNTTHIKLASSAETLSASDFVYVTVKLICTIAHG